MSHPNLFAIRPPFTLYFSDEQKSLGNVSQRTVSDEEHSVSATTLDTLSLASTGSLELCLADLGLNEDYFSTPEMVSLLVNKRVIIEKSLL